MKEFGFRPPMRIQYFLNRTEAARAEALAAIVEREIVRRGKLVGHIGMRPELGQVTDRIRGYPEPVIAVQRVSQREAQVVSFPDGECLSEPMAISEACSLVRELLES